LPPAYIPTSVTSAYPTSVATYTHYDWYLVAHQQVESIFIRILEVEEHQVEVLHDLWVVRVCL
jgi:hypothetical protein